MADLFKALVKENQRRDQLGPQRRSQLVVEMSNVARVGEKPASHLKYCLEPDDEQTAAARSFFQATKVAAGATVELRAWAWVAVGTENGWTAKIIAKAIGADSAVKVLEMTRARRSNASRLMRGSGAGSESFADHSTKF